MKLYELTITDFLNRVDSSSPTPGGGSVSAFVIAQGISLIKMVGHITIPKKKFQGLNEEIKNDYLDRISKLDILKEKIINLIEEDTQAFNKIMDCFKLPKETQLEIELRNFALNEATIYASEVPLNTAKLALEALALAEATLKYATKSAISDFGVGVLLIKAGLEGAVLNVKTNMKGFYDEKISNEYYNEVAKIQLRTNHLVSKLLDDINLSLNK